MIDRMAWYESVVFSVAVLFIQLASLTFGVGRAIHEVVHSYVIGEGATG